MPLEIATYIDDLVVTNPLGTDDKRQGDDHLRLLKEVLNNSFNRANKTFSFPTMVAKTASFTAFDSDDNTLFQCDTTAGAITMSLPGLVLSQGGWRIGVYKTNIGANPVFIEPGGAATIAGFGHIRRSTPDLITDIVWTGIRWVASRPSGQLVATMLDYRGATVPDGFLRCDGSVISDVDYHELAATQVTGSTLPNDPLKIIVAE